MHKSVFAVLVASLVLLCGLSGAEAHSLPTPRQEKVSCEGVDGEVRFELVIEIPNESDSPKALSMRVSDPNVSNDRSEIANFEFAEGLLNNTGGVLVGYVDLSNPKTGRKGERIGGTTLGQLRSVMVTLDMDFNTALVAGKVYSAQAVYLKRIGEELVQDLDCVREK
ncbi:hypothetical protein BH10BDE1_BH10BDE1_19660 [soil metagenome]